MRAHPLPTSLVAGVVAVLLLGACGTGENLSGFCREVKDLNDEFTGNDDDGALVAAMGDLDPPPELAEDWDTMVENWDEFSGSEEVVPEDAPADIEAAERLEERAAEYDRASRAVTAYLRDECGFDL